MCAVGASGSWIRCPTRQLSLLPARVSPLQPRVCGACVRWGLACLERPMSVGSSLRSSPVASAFVKPREPAAYRRARASLRVGEAPRWPRAGTLAMALWAILTRLECLGGRGSVSFTPRRGRAKVALYRATAEAVVASPGLEARADLHVSGRRESMGSLVSS